MSVFFPPTPPSPILWQDGMLLTQMHFRQLEERFALLMAYGVHSASPFFWGVHTLDVDTAMLHAGKYVILRLEAVLPDGTVLSTENATQDQMMFDLSRLGQTPTREGPWYLYVALRKPVEEEHSAEEEDQCFFEGSQDDENVRRLDPELVLSHGLEPPPDGLPLAKFRLENGSYRFDDDYVAPTPFILENHRLFTQCRERAGRVRGQALIAVEQVKQGAGDLETRLQAHSLTAGLLQFEATLNSRMAHPLQLYTSLCQMAGQLAAATLTLSTAPMPAYDHNNIRHTFDQVLKAVDTAMETWPQNYKQYRFEWDGSRKHFVLALPDDCFPNRENPEWPQWILAGGVPEDSDRKAVKSWILDAQIAPESRIEEIRRKRVRGILRKLAETDLRISIPDDHGSVLVEIVPGDSAFPAAAEGSPRELIVMNPDNTDGKPEGLVLFVLRRQEPQREKAWTQRLAAAHPPAPQVVQERTQAAAVGQSVTPAAVLDATVAYSAEPAQSPAPLLNDSPLNRQVDDRGDEVLEEIGHLLRLVNERLRRKEL